MTPHLSRAGVHRLQVGAELPPDSRRQVVADYRNIALDWIEEVAQERLPRKAWRHRSFVHEGTDIFCRVVRVRSRRRVRNRREDLWAARVERDLGPGRRIVTEVVVAAVEGVAPTVQVHVHDHSRASGEAVDYYPAELLANMAERVPLLQDGNQLCLEPIEVTNATMDAFLRILEDPERKMPFVVVTVDPEEGDDGAWQARWVALTRSLAGLAVIWKLSPEAAFKLSVAVDKERSVFGGAWRYYRPGFHRKSDRFEHPLFLRNREGCAVSEVGRPFRHRRDTYTIAEVRKAFRRLAAEDRKKSPSAADEEVPSFESVARQADRMKRGPARLFSFVRGLKRGGAPPSPSTESASASTEALQGPAPSRTPAESGPPSRSSARPKLKEKSTPRRPTETDRKRWVSARRYTSTKRRAEAVERERDVARKRAEQLAGLVRAMGGDPDVEVPFPTTWRDFATWCDECLKGRLVLAPPARRALSDTQFQDVGLAARSLMWLAGDYRLGRLQGGNPQLHGSISDVDGAIFNAPCGGDSFKFRWEGENRQVEWHIKRGANTRDPRRCLRIYYFWHRTSQQVVIASMPGHRKTTTS
jgi:hypothetical protein